MTAGSARLRRSSRPAERSVTIARRLLPELADALPRAPGDRRTWSGLGGSSRGLAIAETALAHDGVVVVIAADAPAAHRVENEILFYATGSGLEVMHFPDWETLPYDTFSPHQDIVSERLATLFRLPNVKRCVLVVPVTTLMTRLPPQHHVQGTGLVLVAGERLDMAEMRTRLDAAGYRCVGQVMEHGEFAVRGSLLDLFPMGATSPYRIDLLDDTIDSIRQFEPESQRSTGKVEQVRLLAAREFPITEQAVASFRERWRARFEGDPNQCSMYRDVGQRLAPSGIEYYLPLFFDGLCTLFDYLPADCLVCELDDVYGAAQACWHEIAERYEQSRHDRQRPLLEPREVFLETGELFGALKRFGRVALGNTDSGAGRVDFEDLAGAPPSLPIDARAAEPLGMVQRFLDEFGGRTLLVAETAGRRESLLNVLAPHGLRPSPCDGWREFVAGVEPLAITVATLERGTLLRHAGIAVVTEAQLFGERALQRRRRRGPSRDAESIVRSLAELEVGAPVVHEDHGVGRYLGLEVLEVGGSQNEFLSLAYASGDKLYVPVASLHLVSRYAGVEADRAPLHRLGSGQWQKARRKAAEKAFDVAAELLEVHARRASRPGHPFTIADEQYLAFTQGFPFEETLDQQTAIDAVLDDMRAAGSMDRLVCGDVGFGKTEVAMRAAFVAVQDGWQVAILVPTTLLAQQHYQTFSDRFADWAVRVEQVSRFRSKKDQEAVLGDLVSGRVDIIIGTHKLLGDDVSFKRLGLVVIDEEHRFGVRQKERFKALRAEVDVLTLTGTPIPRTLNLALSGLRDLSLITTPPQRRLSIKTFVREWNAPLLREAVLREIHRGGQVYVVHNKVENIARIARQIEELVPEATVQIAHGQMRERELERVMFDFYHGRFNVLLCTTIIETGIDVPNANTIIINRADHFGLAQLHQLRGRVGRSHHRAYAYLVVPPKKSMTADAVKRLEAIEALEDLGIGFTLATHDLEIRGAGEILGHGQSGQIQEIGYSLYTEMLERAVRALKAGKSPQLDRPLDHGTEIDLHVPALIPEHYLPDVHSRLIMYKRIASAVLPAELDELWVEMIDRFGLLPPATRTLFSLTAAKLKATPLGIRKIDLGPNGGRLQFNPEPRIEPASLVRLLQEHPRTYRLDGSDKLRVSASLPDAESRLALIDDLLDALATHGEPARLETT